ncbi:MAG: hypothetical protein NTZ51_09285, partial [Proteobacteria bacterium]|nr:hypothetical protein [Pseudomonadota bacterium]
NGDPIMKITAGASSPQITLKVRALQQTELSNQFDPIPGVDDTPIELFFGDQNGNLIAPLTRTDNSGVTGITPGTEFQGAYEVDLEAKGGLISGVGATTFLQTQTPRRVFTAEIDTDDEDKIMTIAADGGDVDAADTTLTLDFNPDFTAPVVGTVTAGNCSISIALTDNKAFDLANSTVTVQKGDTGEDITATLNRTNTNDGTAAGSIDFTNVPKGSYTLTIVARDKANNASASTARTAEVTECTPVIPACKSVDPTYGIIGKTLEVTITGENTSFATTGSTVDSSSVNFSCTGVTVNSQTANSKTEIVANITIAATATEGKCDVSVRTGSETVVCDEGFELSKTPPAASCKSVSPAEGDAGKSVQVTITGENTNFVTAGNTVGSSSVNFGCTGVTVDSVTATSATQIVANFTIADDAADCTGDVTVTTGTETITCTDKFTVNATVVPTCTLTVSPATIKSGIIFPRIKIITITGTGSDFSSSSDVKIDGISRIFILKASKTEIRALIIVPAQLKGEKAVTVDDCTGGTVTFN